MDSLQPNRSNLEDEEEMDTKPLKDDDSAPTSSPSWFTPKRLLSIFCVINMINYVDRGAIASNGVNGSLGTCTDSGTCTSGSGIQGEFNLSNFEDGVLSSAFMVGLLVASPIFASLSKSHNPFRLIGVGLSVWTLAVIGCGCSFDFWSITICRMLVGVGEASFISLAAPFIDDHAPAAQKTAWLATFYMCIPAGVALGYVYGGLVGDYLNWRFAFWVEAIFMLPFAVFGFVMKPLQLKGFSPIESKTSSTSVEIASPVIEDSEVSDINGHDAVRVEGIMAQASDKGSESEGAFGIMNRFSRFSEDMKVLLLDKVYVVNVLGYIAYNFVIGAYSYWGPKAGYNIYHMSDADLLFGGITIVCGIFGTLSGGFFLDYMGAKKKMSWQTYVDEHLMCDIDGQGQHLAAAAIIGHDGSVWAQSSNFPQFKAEEISGIMKDFEEPGHLAPTGLHLGGTKYMVIQGEAGAVIRGKKGSGGVTIKKTSQALVFGIYEEPVTPGQCNMVVERLGDYLVDQGL